MINPARPTYHFGLFGLEKRRAAKKASTKDTNTELTTHRPLGRAETTTATTTAMTRDCR
jgi:hypothetical protein